MTVQGLNEGLSNLDQGELDRKFRQETSVTPNGESESESILNKSEPAPTLLPHPAEDESASKRKWFEDFFFPRICVQEFLSISAKLREGDYTCRFGERNWGAYNVVVYIIFSDGVEWLVKIPRGRVPDGEENKFLKSEYATLVFLQRIGSIPAPKVYGASFDANNPAKTPY
jgi:hypothetical protein